LLPFEITGDLLHQAGGVPAAVARVLRRVEGHGDEAVGRRNLDGGDGGTGSEVAVTVLVADELERSGLMPRERLDRLERRGQVDEFGVSPQRLGSASSPCAVFDEVVDGDDRDAGVSEGTNVVLEVVGDVAVGVVVEPGPGEDMPRVPHYPTPPGVAVPRVPDHRSLGAEQGIPPG
jgi:hypothetical protein